MDSPTDYVSLAAFAAIGKAVMTVAMHQTFHNGEAVVAPTSVGGNGLFSFQ